MNWIIRNVQIFLPEGKIEGDAWIKDGRWAALGRMPDSARGYSFEGKGAWLLPGLIDTHAHLRDMGFAAKGTFYTESRAALAGGVTTVFDMPNTPPPTTTIERWQTKYHAMQGKSWTNYALYFGATEHNLSAIRQLEPQQVPGVKVFLASSTGELLVTNEAYVRQLLRESPVRVVFHSERESQIQAALAQWSQKSWGEVPDLHTRARPPEACMESTQWLLSIAKESPIPIHILHITTAGEVELLRSRPSHVSAETCPIYLQWSAEAFPTYQNLLKCNPSLKYASDREALWQGVIEGVLEVIGTDHAPHTWAEKQQPYAEAPSGVPAHGWLLPWLWTMGQQRKLPITFWLEKMVYAPARLWRLRDRGPIREGYWADAVLFLPEGKTQVPLAGDPSHYGKVAWHPLAGTELKGAVGAVWVSGQLSFLYGRFHGAPAGKAVAFE